MAQHFRYRTLEVQADRPGLSYPIQAIERIGTGLGLYWFDERADGLNCGYRLVHLASGKSLTALSMPSLVQAGRWLKRVCPLADWTQGAPVLKKRRDLREKVIAAYKEECLLC